MNDRHFDLSKYRIRLIDLFRNCRVVFHPTSERATDRWLIAKASLLAHTSQITSKNLFVAARQPSTERSRRRLRESWKRLCTVVDFPREVLIAGRRNHNPDVVLAIQCPDVERMMNRTPRVRTEQGMIEVRQGEIPDHCCAGEHCLCADLHPRAPVPQARSENRPITHRGCRYHHHDGFAAGHTFRKQVGAM